MNTEAVLVVLYLLGCLGIGLYFARRGLGSPDEYWVAGRSIGVTANAMAIMASLASGGSIIGVMGLAYRTGIPFTLSLFAGAILGFPLAAVLVAGPLRRFGSFTLPDFLSYRYPHPAMRRLVPIFIVVSFTVYIIAQMKAAGITAEVLLGISYKTAVTLAAIVFISYVSIGGMLAVTWTDVVQGTLMLCVVLGTCVAVMVQEGSPLSILERATEAAPALGAMRDTPLSSMIGIFVLWAAAIPVIPHIVMRVFTAKDPQGARISLNLAMVVYSVMILAAVLIIVPVGKMQFPELADADHVFLNVMQTRFPAVVRGLAVAAVLAAVMSTTDALLLACSAAITHDLFGARLKKATAATRKIVTVAVPWVIGLFAMFCAYSPPKLITVFYSAAIGLLGASLFVPLIAGLWWKRANTAGGVAALVSGAVVYLFVQFGTSAPKFSAVLFALAASASAMLLGGFLGRPTDQAISGRIEVLHRA
ncbi:MAG: sodium:solute symporter family protein [Elusimicrobiota bacterium]